MGSAEKIRIMRVKNNNMSERDLAQRMGDTPQNLNNKMKRNDFKESELQRIAEALGYNCVIKFVDNATGEEI